MPAYDTVTKVIGDITVTVSKAKEGNAGERLEAFLKWLSEKIVDPGYGVSGDRPSTGPVPPGGAPPQPDQGLPGSPGYPSTGPVPPGGSPGVPTHPIAGGPGINNELPGFIAANAKDIAKAILKGTACDPDKPQPK